MQVEYLQDETIDQIINKEYRIWKYNSHYLYDTLMSKAMEWPSLTVCLIPGTEIDSDGMINKRIILGTHTTSNEQNHLLICKLKLPNQNSTNINQFTKEYS